VANPVENVSLSTISDAPDPAAERMSGARCAKFALRSHQAMSCWIAAMRIRSSSQGSGPSATLSRGRSRRQALEAGDGLVEDVETLAEGEAHEMTALVLVRVEDLVGTATTPQRGASSRQNAMPSPSGRSGRTSTVTK
jgi:hypothetical protein